VKFLIDECLHTSLVELATDTGHEAHHVNWPGLSGEADWDLMPRIIADNFVFVTNNASDFRRLYQNEPLHAGLVIIVPNVSPVLQRDLFALVLADLADGGEPINEAIEIRIEDGEVVLERYVLGGDGT
jgi:predicted nuclease of predicted toxin-antitoxin system